ncbi:hypothetical protein EMIHUDRAFT_242213 [Emiliania huxleyi CCMP1516]|uniref:Uncharacterized protein n=2 Tax=Emiliania huxleyi TaxID=2903 RepID=A0A0D3J9S8_EMIH1|nr:hypothetical protein EMIHUDRAFT_242213 [Emiliania huxleyi CCMP1516]EOD20263.1 hypothetical protein EMIHUDRAFT_242213 [Emiliania huxleyi CCMP1516]|eukprot:XP_005772692.1 hypothetical protein EMIHUDRAFT_242213 [Emiliania huxleyi CCMP1516]
MLVDLDAAFLDNEVSLLEVIVKVLVESDLASAVALKRCNSRFKDLATPLVADAVERTGKKWRDAAAKIVNRSAAKIIGGLERNEVLTSLDHINTAIRANAAGIGFAIPIDTAEKATGTDLGRSREGRLISADLGGSRRISGCQAMKTLSAGGKISHAYLGISMLSLTPEAARLNNADPNSNVYLPEQHGADPALLRALGPF